LRPKPMLSKYFSFLYSSSHPDALPVMQAAHFRLFTLLNRNHTNSKQYV
jgi:hypothetical protein